MRWFNRLGKAGPAAVAVKLVSRGKQRFARYDVYIDTGFVIVQIGAGAGPFGAVLLRYPKLLGRQGGDGIGGFLIGFHRGLSGLDVSAEYGAGWSV